MKVDPAMARQCVFGAEAIWQRNGTIPHSHSRVGARQASHKQSLGTDSDTTGTINDLQWGFTRKTSSHCRVCQQAQDSLCPFTFAAFVAGLATSLCLRLLPGNSLGGVADSIHTCSKG